MANLALFYSTLVILLIAVMAAALSLSTYVVSRRRVYLLAAIAFLFYFFDVAVVFQDDFLLRHSLDQLSERGAYIYLVGQPYGMILTGAGVFVPLWLMVCDFFEVKNRAMLIAPGVAFALGSVIVELAIPHGNVHEFVFVSMRGVFLFWTLGFAVYQTARSTGAMRGQAKKKGKLFWGMFVLGAAVVFENVMLMFVVEAPEFVKGTIFIFPERNPMENMLMLWCALYSVNADLRVLNLHFRRPPVTESDRLTAFINDGMEAYADHYRLSNKEQEVLTQVLLGKDNQNIASTMSIALSTVKVHVHNILKKTGMANRQELISDFHKRA